MPVASRLLAIVGGLRVVEKRRRGDEDRGQMARGKEGRPVGWEKTETGEREEGRGGERWEEGEEEVIMEGIEDV